MFSSGITNTTLENTVDVMGLPGNGSLDGNSSSNNQSSPQTYYFYYDYAAFTEQFRFKLAEFLWQRLTIFLYIISIFGNSIIVLVLSQKKFRNSSTSILIISLAVADTFVTLFLLQGFLLSNGFLAQTYHEIDCKLRLFLPWIGIDASNMTLAIISIERAVSVKIPHKVKLIFTVKISRILVASVWLISFASACLSSYVRTYTTSFYIPACLIDLERDPLAYQVYFVQAKILKIGPWAVNVFCMVFIINTLAKNALVKTKLHKMKINSVTKTLLIVNIVYFVFVTPSVSYDTYTFVTVQFIKPVWNYRDYMNHINVNNLLIIILYTNNVLNFFIYFLIGSRFRKETKEFLLSCKCC